jgi:N-acetylglucosamine kinase-like BadF-type ATPase
MTGDTTVWVGGVDAGGSHTEAAVGDASPRIRARARGPSGAVRPGEIDAAGDTIAVTVEGATTAAGASLPLAALVVGAAGAGQPDVQDALIAILRSRHLADHILVTTDATVAFESVFPGDPGIVLLAGTGSIALARNRAGEWQRAGGLGWRLGDEGSGYALGRDAIAAVAGSSGSALAAALARAAGLHAPAALPAWLEDASPGDIAALAPAVIAAAEEGDAEAGRLVSGAAEGLVTLVTGLLPHFGGPEAIPVALGGGLLDGGGPVRKQVVHRLVGQSRGIVVSNRKIDPVSGAVAMAAGLARGTGPER